MPRETEFAFHFDPAVLRLVEGPRVTVEADTAGEVDECEVVRYLIRQCLGTPVHASLRSDRVQMVAAIEQRVQRLAGGHRVYRVVAVLGARHRGCRHTWTWPFHSAAQPRFPVEPLVPGAERMSIGHAILHERAGRVGPWSLFWGTFGPTGSLAERIK